VNEIIPEKLKIISKIRQEFWKIVDNKVEEIYLKILYGR